MNVLVYAYCIYIEIKTYSVKADYRAEKDRTEQIIMTLSLLLVHRRI